MAEKHFIKDPDAVLDYTIDWETWLDDDAIASVSWVADSGITIDSETNTTTTATVWLSGGTAGAQYELTCSIITANAREDDRTIAIILRER